MPPCYFVVREFGPRGCFALHGGKTKGQMGVIHFTFLPHVRMHLQCSVPVHLAGPPKSLIPLQFYHELERTPRVIDALSALFNCRHNLMCTLPAKGHG